MTEITDEGRQRAAELCNAEPTNESVWGSTDFLHKFSGPIVALARLATASLAWEQDIAERDARIAELEKAMGDIVEEYRTLGVSDLRLLEIVRIATQHAPKPKPDVLTEAIRKVRETGVPYSPDELAARLRAELAKRGITIPGGE